MQKIRKIMALTLSMLMLAGMIPLSASAASFGDTGGHWAETVIDKWASYGIVQGDDAGFRPDDSIRRGEFAVIVDRIMQYKTKAANVFSDLPASEWYTDAALKLNAAGAMNGVGSSSFDPTGFVTRQQAMVILARIFKVAPDSTSLYAFTDADQVASWAFAELGGMVKAGYVQGNDGKISPNANLTRAQAVQLFENIIKGFYNEAGTYSVTTDGVVIVNTPDVILQNSSTGKLFVTPGVGSGDFTLSKSTVKQLIVQGGGRNSINLEDSEVESLSVGVDSSTGALRVHSAGTTTIGAADVQSTSETITFTGDVGVIEVAAGSTVIVEGNVESLTIIGENVTVVVAETASVASLDVQGSGASLDVSGTVETANVTGGEAKVTLNETATVNNLAVEGGNASLDVAGKVASMDIKGGNTTVETKSTAQIDQVTINADNASIGGTGKVPEIKVEGGSGTEVKTEGSKVDVNENAGSVTTGDNAKIDPGTSGDSKGDTEQAGTGGGGGGSGDSSNQNNNTGNNNTGGGYVPVEPTPAPATIVYDAGIADVAALIVRAQEQLAGTYVTELIIEIDKPIGATLIIDSTNFPGSKQVTIKDTQKNVSNANSVVVKRSNVTIDGLQFTDADAGKPAAGHRTAIAVNYIGDPAVTSVIIQNCNISLSYTDNSNALIGIYYDGDTTSGTSSLNNTIAITNGGSGKALGIYGRTNIMQGNTISASSGTGAASAIEFQWTGAWENTLTASGNTFSCATTTGSVVSLGVDVTANETTFTSFGESGGGYASVTTPGLTSLIESLRSQIKSDSVNKFVGLDDFTGSKKSERYYKDANGYIWSQYLSGSTWTYCTAAVRGLDSGYYSIKSSANDISYLTALGAVGANIGAIALNTSTTVSNSANDLATGDVTYTLRKAQPFNQTCYVYSYNDAGTEAYLQDTVSTPNGEIPVNVNGYEKATTFFAIYTDLDAILGGATTMDAENPLTSGAVSDIFKGAFYDGSDTTAVSPLYLKTGTKGTLKVWIDFFSQNNAETNGFPASATGKKIYRYNSTHDSELTHFDGPSGSGVANAIQGLTELNIPLNTPPKTYTFVFYGDNLTFTYLKITVTDSAS